MTNKIQVVITTYQVPFDQVVESVTEFDTAEAAKEFINKASEEWWIGHNGAASAEQFDHGGYDPISEVGYDMARYELWGGEATFHAMIDAASYWRLHEEHYKKQFDDQGLERPGYLQVAYLQGGIPYDPPN